jgi:hypothetical protein
MGINFKSELKRLYGRAALEREAQLHLKPSEWKQFRGIKAKYDGQRAFEKQAFEQEYTTRVEVARRRIMNKRAAPQKKHQPDYARDDIFSKEDIKRQAQRDVRGTHEALIAKLTDMELAETDLLLERAGHRQETREQIKHDFSQATNRRSGLERRTAPKRSRS